MSKKSVLFIISVLLVVIVGSAYYLYAMPDSIPMRQNEVVLTGPTPLADDERSTSRTTGMLWTKLNSDGVWKQTTVEPDGYIFSVNTDGLWVAQGTIKSRSGSRVVVQFAPDCESEFTALVKDRSSGRLCGVGTFEVKRVELRRPVYDQQEMEHFSWSAAPEALLSGDKVAVYAVPDVLKSATGTAEKIVGIQ